MFYYVLRVALSFVGGFREMTELAGESVGSEKIFWGKCGLRQKTEIFGESVGSEKKIW